MAEGTIPEDVRRFLLLSIPTVAHLEAMLLLRSAPSHAWPAQSAAARLYISERIAADLLGELHSAGILAAGEEPGTYRFAPAPELATVIDNVALAYARDLVGVTDLIHSRTGRKAQIFADAFKIRGGS